MLTLHTARCPVSRVQIEQQPNSMQIVHVTNAALPGPKLSSGPHCLTIKKTGQGDTDFTLHPECGDAPAALPGLHH